LKSQYTRSNNSAEIIDLTEAGFAVNLAKNIGSAAMTGAFKMPVDLAKGFIGFLTNTTFSKKYWEKEADTFKQLGRIFLGVYAYTRAPDYVKRFMRKMLKFLPNVKARLINLWTLIYPDIESSRNDEKGQQYNIIMYSPTGRVLARRTISEKEAIEYIKSAGEEAPGTEKGVFKEPKLSTKRAAKWRKQASQQKESKSLASFLDTTEEEILSEALGLPPLKIISDKLRFSEDLYRKCPTCHGAGEIVQNGQKIECPTCHGTGRVYTAKIAPTIVRFRLWIVEVYDDVRNKTYLFVFDTVSPPDKQPVDKWSYEGKQDII